MDALAYTLFFGQDPLWMSLHPAMAGLMIEAYPAVRHSSLAD
jgi:hypothetical protein